MAHLISAGRSFEFLQSCGASHAGGTKGLGLRPKSLAGFGLPDDFSIRWPLVRRRSNEIRSAQDAKDAAGWRGYRDVVTTQKRPPIRISRRFAGYLAVTLRLPL